jgi:hypothetical protein
LEHGAGPDGRSQADSGSGVKGSAGSPELHEEASFARATAEDGRHYNTGTFDECRCRGIPAAHVLANILRKSIKHRGNRLRLADLGGAALPVSRYCHPAAVTLEKVRILIAVGAKPRSEHEAG